MIDFSGTFDTTNALSGMFLWLIFGYLAALLNCDLQRFMQNHPIVVHLFGLTAFFFLFTLLDNGNKQNIGVLWIKTFFIYLLFVLMTKSKWYFVVPVLMLLLVDQSIKKQIAIMEADGKDMTSWRNFQKKTTKILNVIIIVLVIIGTIHYGILQKIEYGSEFSMRQLLFGMSKCKSYEPTYPIKEAFGLKRYNSK